MTLAVDNRSRAEVLASLAKPQREKLLSGMKPETLAHLRYDWRFWGRLSQFAPPGDWAVWLIMAGRGFGKNRAAGEWVRQEIEAGRAGRVALISRTAADTRDVMVEGESGLLNICPPWNKPVWEPSRRKLTWPNGAIATTYTAEEPDFLRGPQHDLALADEIATWKYAQETWDNLMFGLRLGQARCVAVTTPKPTALVRTLMNDARACVTRGTSYENRANLAPEYYERNIARYEGTRLGRQEIYGELLLDVPGALWTLGMIEGLRVTKAPEMRRVVVGIDPAGGGEDETGIVTCGAGSDGHYYVLSDKSARRSPHEWASVALAELQVWQADRIVAEQNFGGEMVEATIRNVLPSAPYKAVTASRGKRLRAEPIAALYERGLVHHVGEFRQLEDEMCNWVADGDGASPDRLDALVWALTELSTGGAPNIRVISW